MAILLLAKALVSHAQVPDVVAGFLVREDLGRRSARRRIDVANARRKKSPYGPMGRSRPKFSGVG